MELLLDVAEVIVEDRIRTESLKTDWTEFRGSFTINGQLEAIGVRPCDGKYALVFGERRLVAITELHTEGVNIPELPAGKIRANLMSEQATANEVKLLIAEFTENEARAPFTFLEKARFIRKFHDMMVKHFGEKNGKAVWTQELTARQLNISRTSISHYLRIEDEVKNNPEGAVAKATTLDAAVKRMKVKARLEERHEAAKADENLFKRASQILHKIDSRELIKTMPDKSVDLVIFDGPWGGNISYKAQENHESYDDSTEYAVKLRDDLFPEIFRVLKDDRFCVFWFGAQNEESMAEIGCSFGFNLDYNRTPCIWFKPDKIVDQNRMPEKQLVDGYEMFFLLRKGDPIFNERRSGNNVFMYERVKLGDIIHPSEKPPALCWDIIKLCSAPSEIVFDPCAGSAAFVDTALRNNRRALGAENLEEFWKRGIGRISDYLKTVSYGDTKPS